MKGFRKWMTFMGTKNMIAIGVLVLLVIVAIIGFAVSRNKDEQKADNKVEESAGLHVEEDLDDTPIDLGDFFEEDESSSTPQPGNGGQTSNGGQTGNDVQTGNNDQTGNGEQTENGDQTGDGDQTENGGQTGNGEQGKLKEETEGDTFKNPGGFF